MNTECTVEQMEFHGLGRRTVVGQFNGGKISSDSGGLLLREVEQRTHILQRLAGCFVDHRDPDQINDHRHPNFLVNARGISQGRGGLKLDEFLQPLNSCVVFDDGGDLDDKADLGLVDVTIGQYHRHHGRRKPGLLLGLEFADLGFKIDVHVASADCPKAEKEGCQNFIPLLSPYTVGHEFPSLVSS